MGYPALQPVDLTPPLRTGAVGTSRVVRAPAGACFVRFPSGIYTSQYTQHFRKVATCFQWVTEAHIPHR
jgi:hypothetical protein